MGKQQVIGLVLILVAAGLLGGAVLGPFSTYQEVQGYETAEATIISSGMESATEQEDGETETEYYPRVEYEYSVDGTSYTDNRVFHASQIENEPGELRGKEFDSQGDARDIVDSYPDGDTASVFYDPADPDVSYLQDPSTDLLVTTAIMGLMGLVFGGIGIGGTLGLVSLNED
ncbi:DUF3592 domain-containing protein [Natrinema halophilum]|uniref:DUF3592 domain-containing protein n=1 Tax=Natrinema halophilum TaxID=1699371 RepID=A0A7D5KXN5_9EURY|nr:DUF3592 domain-containing protein [Natrinema halophilum]QLG49322.1 DUF3592 domain-containing protein [Natrinema halophilum]